MDPLIKSQLLYQLSYAPTRPAKTGVGGHIAATIGPVQPCRNHFPTNRSWGSSSLGEAGAKLRREDPGIHAGTPTEERNGAENMCLLAS